jgi:hypothetical protein
MLTLPGLLSCLKALTCSDYVWAIATGGNMNTSGNLSFTGGGLVAWMSGSSKQRDGIALAEGLSNLEGNHFGSEPP